MLRYNVIDSHSFCDHETKFKYTLKVKLKHRHLRDLKQSLALETLVRLPIFLRADAPVYSSKRYYALRYQSDLGLQGNWSDYSALQLHFWSEDTRWRITGTPFGASWPNVALAVSKEFVEPSKPIWQVLICEVSITGKQTTILLLHSSQPIWRGKDYSRHANWIAWFAAALLKSAVAVECFYHFRPYYQVIMKSIFFTSYVLSADEQARSLWLWRLSWRKWIVIMTLRLTSRIFVGLTTIVVCAFSWLVATALLALNGVLLIKIIPAGRPATISRNGWKRFLRLCFLCSVIITVAGLVLWRRSANRGHSSSRDSG